MLAFPDASETLCCINLAPAGGQGYDKRLADDAGLRPFFVRFFGQTPVFSQTRGILVCVKRRVCPRLS